MYFSEKATWMQGFLIRGSYPDSADIRRFHHHLKSQAGGDNEIVLRPSEVAKALKMQDNTVSTMGKILEKCGALSRKKLESDISMLKFNITEATKETGNKFKSYIEALEDALGKKDRDVYSFSEDALAVHLKVTAETVRGNLNKWRDLKAIEFSAPPKGTIYTLKQDVSGMTFRHMDSLRQAKLEGLDKLNGLVHLTEDARNQTITDHFKQLTLPQHGGDQ